MHSNPNPISLSPLTPSDSTTARSCASARFLSPRLSRAIRSTCSAILALTNGESMRMSESQRNTPRVSAAESSPKPRWERACFRKTRARVGSIYTQNKQITPIGGTKKTQRSEYTVGGDFSAQAPQKREQRRQTDEARHVQVGHFPNIPKARHTYVRKIQRRAFYRLCTSCAGIWLQDISAHREHLMLTLQYQTRPGAATSFHRSLSPS